MSEPPAVYETFARPRKRRGPRPGALRPMNARQRQMLAYIIDYKRATQGHSPTIREMMAALGISSTAAAHYSLRDLATRGCIELAGGRGKTLDIRIPGARWVGPDEAATATTTTVAAPAPSVRLALADVVGVDEVADALGIHPESVRRLIREGRLNARKLGNQWLVSRAYLAGYAGTYRSETGNRPLGQPAAWEVEHAWRRRTTITWPGCASRRSSSPRQQRRKRMRLGRKRRHTWRRG